MSIKGTATIDLEEYEKLKNKGSEEIKCLNDKINTLTDIVKELKKIKYKAVSIIHYHIQGQKYVNSDKLKDYNDLSHDLYRIQERTEFNTDEELRESINAEINKQYKYILNKIDGIVKENSHFKDSIFYKIWKIYYSSRQGWRS